MQPNTHLKIDAGLCGTPIELSERSARVALETRSDMAADNRGLVHGGFVFGLADYAAMLAVNDPNVVLGSANTKFLAPVRSGQRVVANATVVASKGKKREVQVEASVGGNKVFDGTFTCFVLPEHVLGPEEK